MALLEKVTRHSPKMWAPSIVGYGSYRYTAGFAIRARQLVVYLVAERDRQKFLLSSLASTISASLVLLQEAGRSRRVSARATRRRLGRRGQAPRQAARRCSNPRSSRRATARGLARTFITINAGAATDSQ